MNKWWAIAAVSTVLAITAMAQTNVYSKNAVGVIRVDIPANAWRLVSSPLVPMGETNRVSDVLGTNDIPNGATVLFWNGLRYVAETFYAGFGWYPNTNTVARGYGFWLRAPSAFSLYLTGEVPSVTNTTVNLAPGYQLVAFPYPVDVPISNSVLNVVASNGDTILAFTGSNYVATTYYTGFGWFPGDFMLRMGQGYWYRAGSATEWNEPKNVHYTYP